MWFKSFLIKVMQALIYSLKKKTKIKQEVQNWFADAGDKTHRLNYSLNANSIVFDLGGYQGQWASDIYCKYKCKMFVFEPGKLYYEGLVDRFKPNQDFRIFEFGLSNKNTDEKLYLQNDGSSIHVSKQDGKFELIKLVDANEFLVQSGISSIDLMKINIEGGEYDLLEHLINSGWANKIKNIQIQFHDFVPNAEARMESIQSDLAKTHDLTYQYKFVWENWQLRSH